MRRMVEGATSRGCGCWRCAGRPCRELAASVRRTDRLGSRVDGQIGSVLKHAQQFHDLEITDEDEQKIGAAVSERIRQRYGVVQDPPIHKYVTLVGAVLAGHSERPALAWQFIVLDTDGVNALAAPGGYVHITRGALSLMKNEAELAGVLGHEIIHVTEKHTIRAIQKGKVIQMGADETMANNPALFDKLVDKATDVVMAGFGRGEELEADQKGVVLAARVGYDPNGLDAFLTTLAERNKNVERQAGAVRVASGDGGAAEEAGQDHRRPEADGFGCPRRTLPPERHVQAGAADVDRDRRKGRGGTGGGRNGKRGEPGSQGPRETRTATRQER